MNKHLDDVDRLIDHLIARGFADKHEIVFDIGSIVELPYEDFGDMRRATVIVRVAPWGRGYSSAVFSLFANSMQKFMVTVLFVGGVILLPIIGVVLAFLTGSWWLLLLLLTPIIALRLQKKIYLGALFKTIFESEKAFCLAFCGNYITVETPDGKIRERGMAPL